jgi:hypothetical protein
MYETFAVYIEKNHPAEVHTLSTQQQIEIPNRYVFICLYIAPTIPFTGLIYPSVCQRGPPQVEVLVDKN